MINLFLAFVSSYYLFSCWLPRNFFISFVTYVFRFKASNLSSIDVYQRKNLILETKCALCDDRFLSCLFHICRLTKKHQILYSSHCVHFDCVSGNVCGLSLRTLGNSYFGCVPAPPFHSGSSNERFHCSRHN